MPRRLTLPPQLAAWIDQKLPQLGGVSRVKLIHCERLPLERLWRGQKYTGLTLWNRIYLRESACSPDFCDAPSVELLFHELAHVLQFQKYPLSMPVRYLFGFVRYGYQNLPLEIEARELAARLLREYTAQ
ncbi:MAG TPA: hypothetical protein VEK08_26375 [Planctomycetota bacterium]|nr:hypothetical protein [Planctomycetota bacterium]